MHSAAGYDSQELSLMQQSGKNVGVCNTQQDEDYRKESDGVTPVRSRTDEAAQIIPRVSLHT